MKLLVKRKFDAAHRLYAYEGACANLHGHTWKVDVELDVEVDEKTGMSIDFKVLKPAIDAVLAQFDHHYINEVVTFNPTAENLSKYIYGELKTTLPVVKVTVWESDDCGAIYPN